MPPIRRARHHAGLELILLYIGLRFHHARLFAMHGESRTLKAARGDQRGYYAALREALHGQAPNPVPAEQGATVMAIIEAAFRSDKEGRRVVPELRQEERAVWSK